MFLNGIKWLFFHLGFLIFPQYGNFGLLSMIGKEEVHVFL